MSSTSQPWDGLLPVSEVNRPPTELVARQEVRLPSVTSQPNPPGTNMFDGPVQPVSDFLGSSMVRSVVVEGRPPPVWALNSHQEKISGSIAVPPSGAPQATVAVAATCVESWPMTGANQCSVGVLPVTVTRSGSPASTGGAAVAAPRIGSPRSCAVARNSPPA